MFGSICTTIVQPRSRVEHQEMITITKAFRPACSTLLPRKGRFSAKWITSDFPVNREQSRSLPTSGLPITNRGKRVSDYFRAETTVYRELWSSFPTTPFLELSVRQPAARTRRSFWGVVAAPKSYRGRIGMDLCSDFNEVAFGIAHHCFVVSVSSYPRTSSYGHSGCAHGSY